MNYCKSNLQLGYDCRVGLKSCRRPRKHVCDNVVPCKSAFTTLGLRASCVVSSVNFRFCLVKLLVAPLANQSTLLSLWREWKQVFWKQDLFAEGKHVLI